MSISQLQLPPWIYNALRRVGIDTIGQLRQLSEKELLNQRNIGTVAVGVVREALQKQKGAKK